MQEEAPPFSPQSACACAGAPMSTYVESNNSCVDGAESGSDAAITL